MSLKLTPFSRKHFLYQWYKQYFYNERDTSYILTSCYGYEGYSRDTINCGRNSSINIAGELYLDVNNSNKKKIFDIYFQNGQDQHTKEYYMGIEEDFKQHKHFCELGAFNPCIIIDEDKNQNPIYMSEYENILPPDYINFKCFRLVCAMGKKQYAKMVEK